MLFRSLKKLITNYKKNNKTEELADLAAKIDIFYAASKLNDSEYAELTNLLNDNK